MIATPPTAQWTTGQLSQPRRFVSAASVGESGYFAGGETSDGALSDVVDIYDAATDTWQVAHLPMGPRSFMGGGASGTLIAFAGGRTPSAVYSNRVEILDTISGTWTVHSLSVARRAPTVFGDGSKLVIAGGQLSRGPAYLGSNAVDVYDLSTGLWSTTQMAHPRKDPISAVLVGVAFVAGGTSDAGTYPGDVELFDFGLDSFSTGTTTVLGRYGLAAAASEDWILFGGGTTPTALTDRVDRYDAVSDAWTTGALSQPRRDLAAAASAGLFLFAGGRTDSGGSVVATVDIYDAAGDQWSVSSLSVPRSHLAGTQTTTRLLFAGGWDGLGPSDVVDIYVLPEPAQEVPRLGTPPNPAAFLPGQTSDPVVGSTWDPVIDHTSFFQAAALDIAFVSLAPPVNVPSPLGTLLCNIPPSSQIFVAFPPGTPFAVPVPSDLSYVGVPVCSQGLSLGGGEFRLTNALDLVLGTP